MKKYLVLIALAVCLSAALPAKASVIFTFNNPITGSVSLDHKALKAPRTDVFELGGSADVFWDPAAALGKTRRVDGFKLLEVGGDFVFSFAGPKWTNGGTTYTQNDLIRYDSATSTYEKFWTPPNLAAGAKFNVAPAARVPKVLKLTRLLKPLLPVST